MHLTLIIFKLSQDPEFNKPLNRRTDEQTGRETKMLCILYTLLPIQVSSFMRLTLIIFKLSKDPEFNKLLNRRTDEQTGIENKMLLILYTLLPIHVSSFMRLALIVYQRIQIFSGETD